jgi:hypothetical protein
MPNGIAPLRATHPPYYFFLSHSHSSTSGDANRDVDDFYQRLCEHLRHMTSVPADASPGYVDYKMPISTRWPQDVAAALATCAVFVPLYSPRYFESLWCGREWDAFMRRESAHRAGNYPFSAIVPVLWIGAKDIKPPPCASDRQYYDSRLGERYKDVGLYGLKKAHRDQYSRATYYIARTICDVAAATKLDPCDPAIFDLSVNAFVRT